MEKIRGLAMWIFINIPVGGFAPYLFGFIIRRAPQKIKGY